MLVDCCKNSPRGASLTLPLLDSSKLKDKFEFVGADIITHTPEVCNWLKSIYPGKRLVIGSYIYLDGADHVRASVAMDCVISRVITARSDTALMYLGSPAVVVSLFSNSNVLFTN